MRLPDELERTEKTKKNFLAQYHFSIFSGGFFYDFSHFRFRSFTFHHTKAQMTHLATLLKLTIKHAKPVFFSQFKSI